MGMKMNNCGNCGSNELVFSNDYQGGVSHTKIECRHCKNVIEVTDRSQSEAVDIWNTNNEIEIKGDERMLPCLKCGSKNVSADLQLTEDFIGNFIEFGCSDCMNRFLTGSTSSEKAIIKEWNRRNQPKEEPATTESDDVNHPSHYQSESGIECIDVIIAALGIDGAIAYCRGNVIKYSWRTDKKNGAQDLRKAEWYSRKAAELMGEEE